MSENTDAVKAAQAKIKALTARRKRSASSRIASCTELTTEVKTLTVYISENPKSTKIKVRFYLDAARHIIWNCRFLPPRSPPPR